MAELANLQIVVGADTSQAERGLDALGTKVGGVGSAIQSALGAAAVGAVVGIGAAFVGSVKSAADFEKQMSAVSAVSGASASEMEGLTKAALQLGKDTSFSASEAATGIEELVKAGVSIADVMGGGARAALDLAAAGAISVGDAAEIASNAMNVFGLKGADMAHVADVIAGAANASAIGVNDYKFSLAAAGAVAATVGISFESLSQAIAVMGNAGIKGSDAGTSLKTMMMNLIPTTNKQNDLFRDLGIMTFDVERGLRGAAEKGIKPATEDMAGLTGAMMDSLGIGRDVAKWTQAERGEYEKLSSAIGLTKNEFFTATGEAKSFGEIAQVLQDALKGMTKEQQLATLEVMFGSDAIRAGAVLLKAGAAGFDEMAAAMGKVTARGVAEERLNNLWGSIEKLKGSLETGAIILGGMFTPALKRMADMMTDQVNAGIDVLEQIPDVIATISQVLAGDWAPDSSIHSFTNAVGMAVIVLRDQFGPAVSVVSTFVMGTLVPAFTGLSAPIAAAVAAFLGVIATAGVLSTAITAVAVVLGFLLSPLGLVALAAAALAAAWVTNFMGIQEATAAAWAAMLPTFTAIVDWLGVQIPLVLTWISEVGWPALVAAGEAVAAWIIGTLIPALTQAVEWLGPKIVAVLTWITETGWPAMLAAGEAVATFITGTLIPGITSLIEWLGPKLVPVVEWISGTGWPALVTAGEAVYAMVQQVITFFTALFVELEKRSVFTDLGVIWDQVVVIGGTLWALIVKVFDAVTTLQVAILALLVPFKPLVELFGMAAEKAGGATTAINLIAGAVQLLVTWVDGAVTSITTMLGLLAKLADFKMPTFTLPSFGGGGGGGTGLTPQSYSGGGSSDPSDFLAQAALARGIDPQQVLAVMGREGPGGWGATGSFNTGTSYGPLQLHYAGGSNPQRGMGDDFTRDTGIDLRTDKSVQAGQRAIEYALDRLSKTGDYREWYGADPALGSRFTPVRRVAPAGAIPKIPLGGGGPGGDPSQWPGFMQQVDEQLPDYLLSLDTIRQSGVGTFGAVATGAAVSGAALVTASTDSLGNVTRIYSEGGVAIGATITSAAGVVMNTWGTMSTGVTAQSAAMSAGVVANTNLMTSGALVSVTGMGAGILTSVTDSAGTTIATVTNMQGQVTAQYATLANGAQLSMSDMGAGILVSTTDLGTGVMTTVQDMSGNYITTITDLSGNVTAQYTQLGADVAAETATMNTEVTAETATMATNVLTSVTDLGDGVLTITQDTSGQMVATITDMAGNVVETYTSMGTDVTGSVEEMASAVVEQYGEIAAEATSSTQPVEDFYAAAAQELDIDFGDAIKEFEKLAKAAKKAADAVDDVGGKGGKKSGDDDDDPFGRDSGKKGDFGESAAYGDDIVPNRGLLAPMMGAGAGGSTDTLILKVDIGGRIAEEIYVTGRDLAIQRGRA